MVLYAGAQIGTAQQIKAAREAEIAKLGPTAQSRVDSVITWFKAMVGDEATRNLTSMMVSADIVNALEKVITRFGNQGASSYNATGRDVQPRSISDEEWGRMSYHQKAEYQRQYAAGQRR